MQNILINFSEDESTRYAWKVALMVLAYIGAYALMGSVGDSDPSGILTIDPISLLLFQGIIAGVFFILLPGIFIVHFLKFRFRNLMQRIGFGDLFYVSIISISGMVVLSVVVQWNMSIEFPSAEFQQWAMAKEEQLKVLTEHIVNFQSPWHFIIALLVIGGVAAIGEEILFRGLLQNLLAKVSGNVHVGIWISAILFSAIHLQFYGFFPRMLLGALFGYLYLWSGKLTIAMLAHSLHNSISLVMVYISILKLDSVPISPDQMDQAAPWSFVMIFLVIGIWAVIRFKKHNEDGTLAKGI